MSPSNFWLAFLENVWRREAVVTVDVAAAVVVVHVVHERARADGASLQVPILPKDRNFT
jgi:hypothetical protein